jgi:Bacterial TniB protein
MQVIPTKDFENPNHAKVAALDSIFVTHRSLTEAIDGITECISWSRVSLEPKGALLAGLGGAGKTTICRAILKRFPPEQLTIDKAVINTVPAFFCSVPSPSGIKALASQMLEKLGDPAPGRGTAPNMTNRLCKLLKECRTRVIILDELHHLLKTKGRRHSNVEDVCEWLKGLMNDAGVMLCLVGTPACEAILQTSDGQMSRRFAHRYRLQDLSCGTLAAPGDLAGFLQRLAIEYSKSLDGLAMPEFHSHELVAKMWAATSGRPSFITLLLQKAILAALNGQRTSVTVNDLAYAFSEGVTIDVAQVTNNPFEMSEYRTNSAVLSKMRVHK